MFFYILVPGKEKHFTCNKFTFIFEEHRKLARLVHVTNLSLS